VEEGGKARSKRVKFIWTMKGRVVGRDAVFPTPNYKRRKKSGVNRGNSRAVEKVVVDAAFGLFRVISREIGRSALERKRRLRGFTLLQKDLRLIYSW